MSVTECHTIGPFALTAQFGGQDKNGGDFGKGNVKSVGGLKGRENGKKAKTKKTSCLPINFFHSPGQYNKMIIKCASPEIGCSAEMRMGIIKNLEFLNEPLFEKQRDKRNERVAQYCEKRKKQKELNSEKASSVQECTCCCCDNFCRQCAKSSICQVKSEIKQSLVTDLLVELEAMKKKEKPKPKRISSAVEVPEQLLHPHLCCQSKEKRRFRIERLINQSLIKQVEMRRQKQLQMLSKAERQKIKEQFNNTVRQLNRANSVSKIAVVKQSVKQMSKRDLRWDYWNEVKDIVRFQLRKDKVSRQVLKPEEKLSPRKNYTLTAEEMRKKRISRGKEALKEETEYERFKKEVQMKNKTKKMLALAAKQADIIRANKKQHFQPTKEMIEKAFKQLAQEEE